jgi:integrase
MLSDAVRSKREALRVREDNPAQSVPLPDRGVIRAKAYLEPSEFLALVTSERVPLRFRRIYALAVYTFCRAGELEALRWCDVDLEHSKLLIHAASGRKGERRETKGKNHREPLIEERLLPLLRAMKSEAGADADDAAVIRLPKREDGGRLLRTHLQRAGGDSRRAVCAARRPDAVHGHVP